VILSGLAPQQAVAGTPEGVALAIVYDTSGSMLQQVPDADGNPTPKYIIASRALNAVLDRLQVVASGPEGSRPPIQAGMVVFEHDHGKMAVPLRAFDPEPFRHWLKLHGKPQRGTPLGDSVRMAGEAVLGSPLPRKHVLVITDGINTQGPDPVRTIPKLLQDAQAKNAAVNFHFIAFDVNANVFAGVKKLGATVVGATDEKQLTSQLEFIMSKKILLEEEEPPTSKPN
jgi:hypothetical protein